MSEPTPATPPAKAAKPLTPKTGIVTGDVVIITGAFDPETIELTDQADAAFYAQVTEKHGDVTLSDITRQVMVHHVGTSITYAYSAKVN